MKKKKIILYTINKKNQEVIFSRTKGNYLTSLIAIDGFWLFFKNQISVFGFKYFFTN
jgi:hypothetical protein